MTSVPSDIALPNFDTDRAPAWYAELYRRDGLRGGHVIMLGPGNDAAAREALAALPRVVGRDIVPEYERPMLNGSERAERWKTWYRR